MRFSNSAIAFRVRQDACFIGLSDEADNRVFALEGQPLGKPHNGLQRIQETAPPCCSSHRKEAALTGLYLLCSDG